MSPLEELRTQLDAIDEEVIQLLAQRFVVCQHVAEYKLRTGTPLMQPQRIEAVKNRAASNGSRHGLREAFVHSLYDLIIREACHLEEAIIARGSEAKVGGET